MKTKIQSLICSFAAALLAIAAPFAASAGWTYNSTAKTMTDGTWTIALKYNSQWQNALIFEVTAHTGTDWTLKFDSSTVSCISSAGLSGKTEFYLDGRQTELGNGQTLENSLEEVDLAALTQFTAIRGNAFKNLKSLKTVRLPTTVREIQKEAFDGCTCLDTLTGLDNVTTLSQAVFRNTQLVTLNLPELTTISEASLSSGNDGSFGTMPELVEVDIGKAQLKAYVFKGSSKLKRVVARHVTTVPTGAFYYMSSITNIHFGASPLTSVGKEAFRSCTGLQSVTWDGGEAGMVFAAVSDWGSGCVFQSCNALAQPLILTNIQWSAVDKKDSSVTPNWPLSDGNPINLMFNGGAGFTSLNVRMPSLPTGASVIKTGMKNFLGSKGWFWNLTAITNAVIDFGADKPTHLEGGLFGNASQLRELSLPSTSAQNIRDVGGEAFYPGAGKQGAFERIKCKDWVAGTADVYLPAVTNIGDRAFASGNISSVAIGTSKSSPENLVIRTTDEYRLSDGIKGAFCYCRSLTNVIISANKITKLGAGDKMTYYHGLFWGDTQLQSVEFHANAIQVTGSAMFAECSSLSTVLWDCPPPQQLAFGGISYDITTGKPSSMGEGMKSMFYNSPKTLVNILPTSLSDTVKGQWEGRNDLTNRVLLLSRNPATVGRWQTRAFNLTSSEADSRLITYQTDIATLTVRAKEAMTGASSAGATHHYGSSPNYYIGSRSFSFIKGFSTDSMTNKLTFASATTPWDSPTTVEKSKYPGAVQYEISNDFKYQTQSGGWWETRNINKTAITSTTQYGSITTPKTLWTLSEASVLTQNAEVEVTVTFDTEAETNPKTAWTVWRLSGDSGKNTTVYITDRRWVFKGTANNTSGAPNTVTIDSLAYYFGGKKDAAYGQSGSYQWGELHLEKPMYYQSATTANYMTLPTLMTSGTAVTLKELSVRGTDGASNQISSGLANLSLRTLQLPTSGLTALKMCAGMGYLTTVTPFLPSCITQLGGGSPYANNANYSGFYNCTRLTGDADLSKITTFGYYGGLFMNTAITSAKMPSTWTRHTNTGGTATESCGVPSDMFNNCAKLATVDILDDSTDPIKYLGARSFYRCTSLTMAVKLPNLVAEGVGTSGGTTRTQIFASSAIESVEIGAAAKYVDNSFCESCGNLKTATFAAGSVLDTLHESVFSGCSLLNTVTVPSGTALKTIKKKAFANCTALATFDYLTGTTAAANQITTVGGGSSQNGAFYNALLTDLNICLPSIGAESLAAYAFEGAGQATVTLGPALTQVNEGVFKSCKKMTSATFTPQSGTTYAVTSIGKSAFEACSSLKTLNPFVPDSVTTLGTRAFASCSLLMGPETGFVGNGLTTLAVADGVGDQFLNCGTIQKLTFGENLKAFPASVIRTTDNNQTMALKSIAINATSGVTLTGQPFGGANAASQFANFTRVTWAGEFPTSVTAAYVGKLSGLVTNYVSDVSWTKQKGEAAPRLVTNWETEGGQHVADWIFEGDKDTKTSYQKVVYTGPWDDSCPMLIFLYANAN